MRTASLALLALLASGSALAQGVKALEGKKLPAWSMKTTDGKTLSNTTTKGRVVLMDFWATWCGPCKQVTPVVQKLFTDHSAKGLLVIGVNGLEQKKGPQAAKAYKEKGKYTFPFTYDNDALMKKWKIQGVPTLILVDRKGVVRFTANEWTPAVQTALTKAVQKAVAEKA